MTSPATANLRNTIRELLATTLEADPGLIAKLAIERVPAEDEHEILIDLARDLCRDVMRSSRGVHSTSTGETSGIDSGRWGPLRRKYMSGRHCVDGSWKLFAYLNPVECDWLSEYHHQEAEKNEASSRRFALLAKELRKRKKGKLLDLPDSVIEEVMSS